MSYTNKNKSCRLWHHPDDASAGRKEHDDAEETAKWIKDAGAKYILLPGDLADESVCQ